jgi:hypothetical protein
MHRCEEDISELFSSAGGRPRPHKAKPHIFRGHLQIFEAELFLKGRMKKYCQMVEATPVGFGCRASCTVTISSVLPKKSKFTSDNYNKDRFY